MFSSWPSVFPLPSSSGCAGWRSPRRRCWSRGLVLIVGGALGNLIDRLCLGHVVDFISVHWGDAYFPAFNVADARISIGAALVIFDSLREAVHERRAKAAGTDS